MFTSMVAGMKRYSFHGGLCFSCLAEPYISKMYHVNADVNGMCLSLSIGSVWESQRFRGLVQSARELNPFFSLSAQPAFGNSSSQFICFVTLDKSLTLFGS